MDIKLKTIYAYNYFMVLLDFAGTIWVSQHQKGDQEIVSGSGISWAICKSAPWPMPAPHHSVFYKPDAIPAAKPTASMHWRHKIANNNI